MVQFGSIRDGRLRLFLLLAGVALAAAGSLTGAIPWSDLSTPAARIAAGIGAAALLSWVLGRATRTEPFWWLVVGGITVPAVLLGAVAALFAGLLLIAAGAAVGSGLRGLPIWARPAMGLALIGSAAGWLLMAPIHHPWLWLSVCIALIAWRWLALKREVAALFVGLDAAVRQAPWPARVCAALLLPGLLLPWTPLVGHDDLAYHLILGHELMQFGAARFDVGVQSWAMAPWLGDVLHAIVMVISRIESAGPLNAFWYLGGVAGAFAVARFAGAAVGQAWIVAALYATIPTVVFQTANLQVEVVAPVFLAALVLKAARAQTPDASTLLCIALLAAALLALKVSMLAIIGPVGLWLLIKWRFCVPVRGLGLSVLAASLVALPSYAQAWLLTGNPTLPLFNALFGSPWFGDANFRDEGWFAGMRWTLPWDLSFHSQLYNAGSHAGAAGLALVVLAAGWLLALDDRRVRPAFLVSLAGMLLLFSQMHYLRYVLPSLVVLIPLAAGSLLGTRGFSGVRVSVLAIVAAMQVVLLPTASWILMADGMHTLAAQGSETYVARFSPVRALVDEFERARGPTDRLLHADPSAPLVGITPGQALGVSWHSPRSQAYIEGRASDPAAWAKLIEDTGATHVLIRDAAQWPGLHRHLRLSSAKAIGRIGTVELYALTRFSQPVDRLDPDPRSAQLAAWVPAPLAGDILSVDVALSCSEPGEPLALSWTVDLGAGAAPADHSWLYCGADRRARSRAHLLMHDAAAHAGLALYARAADPASGMRVGVELARKEVRAGGMTDGALGRQARQAVCQTLSECDLALATLRVEPMPESRPPHAIDPPRRLRDAPIERLGASSH